LVIASLSQPNISETEHIQPLKRSATDSLSAKIKRERTDDGTFVPTDRPRKHPRRTLSEQIVITKFTEPPILSPRSPAPERVNSALQHRIQALKDENADLRDSITGLEDEKADLRKELRSVKARLTNVEVELASLRERVERAGKHMEG
jgi:cell division protein FtsB